jgi:hypothetical protein
MESGVCRQRSTSWRTAAGGQSGATGPDHDHTSGAAALRFFLRRHSTSIVVEFNRLGNTLRYVPYAAPFKSPLVLF